MPRLTEHDVVKLMDTLSNWSRWGADDELGTINHVTPAVRTRAAALVHDGLPRESDRGALRCRHR